MPLKINKKIFKSATAIKEMMEEVKKLPSLKIVPAHEKRVTSSEAILCLQREIAYVDQTNPIASNIRYLGSKNVKDCLLLYLYNETDHLVVHVDNTPAKLDLYPYLEKFKYKKGIKVILAGGMVGQRSSVSNLEKCINALVEVTEKLGVEIEIDSQNIIEANQFDVKTDRYQFLFDWLMTQANLLSQLFYGKNFDFEKFKNRSADDFKYRRVGEEKLLKIYFCLNEVNQFLEVVTKEKIKKALIDIKYEDFIVFIDKAISKTGLELIDDNWINAGFYKGIKNKLSNFVFDIQNPSEIIVINKNLSTFYEQQRELVLIEWPPSLHYFLVYDGVIGEYNLPKLSSQMEGYFERIRNAVAKEDWDIEKFEKISAEEYFIFNYFDKCEIVECARRLNLAEVSRGPTISNCNFKFFRPPIYSPDEFFPSTIVKLNNMLKTICLVESHKFVGKMRQHPRSVLDALLLCNNAGEVRGFKFLIDALLLHIGTKTVAYTLKLDEENYCICVPAVNVNLFPTTGTLKAELEAEEAPINTFN